MLWCALSSRKRERHARSTARLHEDRFRMDFWSSLFGTGGRGRGGGRGKGDYSPAVSTFHERIVVQRVVDPSGPRALDVALAKGAQRRKYPFALLERSTGDVSDDLR